MKTLFVQLRQFAIARSNSPISIAFYAAPATLSARRFHSWTRTIFLSHRTSLLPNLRMIFPPQFGTPPDACGTTNGWGSARFAPKAKAIVWNGGSLPNTCPQFLEYRLVFGCAVEMLSSARELAHERDVRTSHGLQEFEFEIRPFVNGKLGAVPWIGSLNLYF
jgi:hypothetical protein